MFYVKSVDESLMLSAELMGLKDKLVFRGFYMNISIFNFRGHELLENGNRYLFTIDCGVEDFLKSSRQKLEQFRINIFIAIFFKTYQTCYIFVFGMRENAF